MGLYRNDMRGAMPPIFGYVLTFKQRYNASLSGVYINVAPLRFD
jgi:hypothetical protein